MLPQSAVVPAAIVVAALLGSSCESTTPSPVAPTQAPAATTAARTPTPPAIAGVWNVTVWLTDVAEPSGGSSCVAETMRSQLGARSQHSLSIADDGVVTVASASRDYLCTFTPLMDNSGFTTYDQRGYYSCAGEPKRFRCADGTTYDLISLGQNISGRVSGAEIAGTWDISWSPRDDSFGGVSVKAQFTGTR